MLLSVSRLMFAWAEDGIFPSVVARVHSRFHTPHLALAVSGTIASIGVLGSHFAGDFFLGIDIMVTAMMVTEMTTHVGIDNPRNCQSTVAHSPEPVKISFSASASGNESMM